MVENRKQIIIYKGGEPEISRLNLMASFTDTAI